MAIDLLKSFRNFDFFPHRAQRFVNATDKQVGFAIL